MLPCAASAMMSSAVASNSTSSVSRMAARCAAMRSGRIFFRLNCKHRDSTVIGTFFGSVVASRNFTCGGGSSSVFNRALKLEVESMCTSSMRYTL